MTTIRKAVLFDCHNTLVGHNGKTVNNPRSPEAVQQLNALRSLAVFAVISKDHQELAPLFSRHITDELGLVLDHGFFARDRVKVPNYELLELFALNFNNGMDTLLAKASLLGFYKDISQALQATQTTAENTVTVEDYNYDDHMRNALRYFTHQPHIEKDPNPKDEDALPPCIKYPLSTPPFSWYPDYPSSLVGSKPHKNIWSDPTVAGIPYPVIPKATIFIPPPTNGLKEGEKTLFGSLAKTLETILQDSFVFPDTEINTARPITIGNRTWLYFPTKILVDFWTYIYHFAEKEDVATRPEIVGLSYHNLLFYVPDEVLEDNTF